MPTPAAIQIRPLKSIDELKAVEELQLEVWQCSEREVLPSLALIPLLDIGGVVLGAFEQREMIGFVVGFPGVEDGVPIIHSDMLAVKAAYRSTGLGFRLKLAQRDAAIAKGVSRITWTFDPLQSANAHLNFAKLGVTASHYKIDYYGETSSALHRTGTDRLWVDWDLQSERVNRQVTKREPQNSSNFATVPALLLNRGGEPVLGTQNFADASLRIEIPDDINAIIAADESRARRWREATRRAFTSALAANFLVADFFRDLSENGEAGSYLLTRSN